MAVFLESDGTTTTLFVSDVRSLFLLCYFLTFSLSFVSFHIQLTITTMTGRLVLLLNLILVLTNLFLGSRASSLCFTHPYLNFCRALRERIFPTILNTRQKMTTH